MDPAIAIELGSRYAQVGILQNGSFLLFPDESGTKKIPSCVAFTDNGILVGSRALEKSVDNPRDTIYNVRQLLGRKFYDPDFQREIKYLPYEVADRNGRPAIRVTVEGGRRLLAPEEILAKLLEHLKARAEKFLGRVVRDVVLSAPDYFSDEKRQAIRDAVFLAGMNTLRIINESKAASFAYDVHNWKDVEGQKDEAFFLMYHFWSECCYVTLESVEEGIFETLSIARNDNLGGDDTEGRSQIPGPDARDSASHFPQKAATVDLYDDSYVEMERMVNQVLQETKLEKGDLDGIILTGNPTHVENILPFFETYFGTGKILNGIRTDESVMQGLASQAEILSSHKLTDMCCFFNVTPLSLGIETIGGSFTKVIPRNTVVPTRKFRIVTTVQDKQSKIVLRILQGERPMTSRNNHVGTIEITGIHAAPKSTPHITVEFEHDDDRTLTVSALEEVSGGKFQLIIVLDNTRDEIEEYITDWEVNAEEDSEWHKALDTTVEWKENEYEFGAVLKEGDLC